jgi:hypothetical protein
MANISSCSPSRLLESVQPKTEHENELHAEALTDLVDFVIGMNGQWRKRTSEEAQQLNESHRKWSTQRAA